MASSEPAVSSDPSSALEQVEKESIQHVKPIVDDESPGLDVTTSGPEKTADVVVSEKVSQNDSVPEVDKGDVSGGTDGDVVNKDLEEPSKRDVDESEAEVIKAEPELKSAEEIPEGSQNIESSESLDAVAKEDVEVKDLSEKIEVPDVGKNEDFSEEKARVIQELVEKESAEPEAADKIEVDPSKNEESGIEPISIEKPNQEDGITTTEEAHVEQKDRDFPPEAVIDTKGESNITENVVPDEENKVPKEEDTVVKKEINDVFETEQTSKEIEVPADIQGNKDETVGAADIDDIEAEKKVDAEELHKPETGAEEVKVAEKIDVDGSKVEDNLNKKVDENNTTDVEPVATEKITEVPTPEAVAGDNDESSIPEAKGINEETDKTQLPESGVEEVIEPSESLDDVAKGSSILESSMPKASNVELEQSEAEITKANDQGNSGAEDVKNEDLSSEKDETPKESAETDAVDKFEIDAAKDEESQANKLEGFELKSESAPQEPIATTDESNVEIPENIDTENKKEDTAVVEAKGSSDVSETSKDIELPTDIEGKKDNTLASILKNDKDFEVEKKIDAEDSLESETGTKGEDIAEELKEVVATESTEKTDIDAAKEVEEPVADTEDTNAKHIDTETPDPIKTEDDTNSIKTSVTDAETEEKKEGPVVPEAKKTEETTQVDQTSREIQLPATNEEAQETIEEEVEENTKLDASDDVKTTEEAPKDEEVVPKQKQSNNLLSKVKQSLVKAKKAIIKKTPSKTPPPTS